MSPAERPLSRRSLLASAAAVAGLAACGPGAVTADPTTAAATPTGPTTSPSTSTPTPHPSPVSRAPAGADVRHGSRAKPSVALTFHGAGDIAVLRKVLRELKSANAHVTVLAVGTWLDSDHAIAAEVLDGGHDLGNHTWSHQVMPRLSAAQADTEVARAAALLHRLVGNRGAWFRPSGTPTSTATIRAAAGRAGYARCLSYDVDPEDYLDPGPTLVRDRVLAAVRPGSVVSLHLGHPGTAVALPGILDGLSSRGLRAVTATELLGTGVRS